MLRGLRENEGFTQEHLADLCKIDRTHLSNIEREKSCPSLPLFIALIKHLGYNIRFKRAAAIEN